MVTPPRAAPVDAMTFAKRLHTLRKENSLTQTALAERVGVHASNIRCYEASTNQPILDVLRRPKRSHSTPAQTLSRSTPTDANPTTTSAPSFGDANT